MLKNLCFLTVFLALSLSTFGLAHAAERVFAVVYPVINPFFEATSRGAENEAERLGVEVLIKGPDRFDVEQQIAIVEDLIERKVDGFGIGSVDPTKLTPYIDRAVEQGIKVVAFDSDAPLSKRLAYIGTNNFKAGEHMAHVLGTALGGKGKVLVSMGIPSQLNLKQRLQGLEYVLKDEYPDITIVEMQSGWGSHNLTLQCIENMTDSHPDFDALVGIDSFAGPAMVIVWKGKGLSQVAVTFDDLPETIGGVRNGQIYAAIVQRQYDWGVNVVKQLNHAVGGGVIPENTDTGTLEITKTNLGEYYSSE